MIEPTQNRILIERTQSAKFTESGLTIPESAQNKEITGKVLAKGNKVKEDIPIGAKVLFGVNDGVSINPVYCDGIEGCILLSEDTIRGVIND